MSTHLPSERYRTTWATRSATRRQSIQLPPKNSPKLKRKYGPSVTYGESPHGHIRTEFAFDVEELTNAEFAPPAYLSFIGFQVPSRFLEQAFVNTYGFDIHEILGRAHPALRSYRTSVRSFIPAFAEAEVVLHRHHFLPRP